jgi:hypothetical protein
MHRPRWAFIYWRSDLTPLMSLAGDPARCTAYLMGNHTIAEQIYREDPLAMLNAPLRTAIYEDTANRTRVAIDESRMVFASFANTRIAQVGIELNHKLNALLEELDGPVRGARWPRVTCMRSSAECSDPGVGCNHSHWRNCRLLAIHQSSEGAR